MTSFKMAEAAGIVPSLMNLTIQQVQPVQDMQPVQPVQPEERKIRRRPRHWNKREVREKREYWAQVHAAETNEVKSESQPELGNEPETLSEIQPETDDCESFAENQLEVVEKSEPEAQAQAELLPISVGCEATVEIGVADFNILSMTCGEKLSKKMNWLLRWGMPEKNMPYSEENGSVSVSLLARYCGVPKWKVEMATDRVYGQGKQRMVILVTSEKEKRIASTGGHSFMVRHPPGHSKISEERAAEIMFLVHKTDSKSIELIRRTGTLKDIKREGGINFTIQTSGSYRKRATHEVTIDIVKAIRKGYTFFLNKFTGIVYGQGIWQGTWWNGEILLGLDAKEEEDRIARIIRVA